MKKACNNSWFITFLIEPKYRIYRHLSVLLYVAFFFIGLCEMDDKDENHYTINLMWNGYFISMFYFNMYVLIPAFLYKSKYFSYLFTLFTIIVCFYLGLTYFTETYLNGYVIVEKKVTQFYTFWKFFIAIHMVVMMVLASTAIKLFQRWARDNIRINELETNSLQMELRELKNQINPHFLFNMLNNVNVLVRKDPDKASLVIHKLSDFLRYQLYENNQQAVLLLPEIQFLNDFMELEKTRRDDFNFVLNIENESGDNDRISKLLLPPNLFICFIENTIKHSVDLENPSQVKVIFRLYTDKLLFICANSKPEEPAKITENSGLGLANIKRRLELLYGNDYELRTENAERLFKVTLILPV